MTVFVVSVLVVAQLAVIGALIWLLHHQTRDWQEERLMLLKAAMARSLPEFSGSIPVEPAVRHDPYQDLEGFEAPVGL